MKHSQLNTSDALHYAKVKTFSGNPALVSPDFADQILVATDTNKIYRATGTATGQLAQTISDVEQTNSTQLVGGTTGTGTTPVESTPLFVGQTYFDVAYQIDWIAIHTRSKGGWIEKGFKLLVAIALEDQTAAQVFANQPIEIYFTDIFTPEYAQGGSSLFAAEKLIGEHTPSSITPYINELIFPQGTGFLLLRPKNWMDGYEDVFSVDLDVISDANAGCGFDFSTEGSIKIFRWYGMVSYANQIKIEPLLVTLKATIMDKA